MKIERVYSHLNGLEFLLVHHKKLWGEVKGVIADIDANACRTKVSKEKDMLGSLLYAPTEMNACFHAALAAKGWAESRVSYWVTEDEKLIRQTLSMSAKDQKAWPAPQNLIHPL